MSAGVWSDEQRRKENIRRIKANEVQYQKLCERCGGTGNEFYWMYRACSDCHGSGLVSDGTEDRP